jgi:hypothetical protein
VLSTDSGLGQVSGYSDFLWAGQSGHQIAVGMRFLALLEK